MYPGRAHPPTCSQGVCGRAAVAFRHLLSTRLLEALDGRADNGRRRNNAPPRTGLHCRTRECSDLIGVRLPRARPYCSGQTALSRGSLTRRCVCVLVAVSTGGPRAKLSPRQGLRVRPKQQLVLEGSPRRGRIKSIAERVPPSFSCSVVTLISGTLQPPACRSVSCPGAAARCR